MGIIAAGEMRMGRDERRLAEEAAAARERLAEQARAMVREANRIRDEHLLEATNALINKTEKEYDISFIASQLDAWKQVLLKINADQTLILIENSAYFPQAIKETFLSLLPVLQLKTFTFANNVIFLEGLMQLLSLAQNAFRPSSPLVAILVKFTNKMTKDFLTDQQTLCLQRIITDYQKGLLGKLNLVDDMVVNQLLATTTLSQLNPVQVITQGLDINVENFTIHYDIFKSRVTSLPLNEDNRITMNEVMLPGILSVINDEQIIVNHVRDHYGTLYYLNDKLPLHTDHTSVTNPEEYRQTLHLLLINFFGAAEIAHSKGLLNEFCEQICSGYCFEGRVGKVFDWVAALSNVLSFDDTVNKYLNKEYVPYAETMADDLSGDRLLADPIIDFMMARHKNANCIPHEKYAPRGKFTLTGLKKYLCDTFGLVSQRDNEQALRQIRGLRQSLEYEKINSILLTSSSRIVKEAKINALKILEDRIATGTELPACVVQNVKTQHPIVLQGYFSTRTKKLFSNLEDMNSIHLTNSL